MTELASPQIVCRDCLKTVAFPAVRCPHCRSPRLTYHAELHQLSIAHLDCDAFYAAVEKRDNPELRDKPVIVGGGERGVASCDASRGDFRRAFLRGQGSLSSGRVWGR